MALASADRRQRRPGVSDKLEWRLEVGSGVFKIFRKRAATLLKLNRRSSIPTPTAVAGVGFSPAFVCLFFQHDILKTDPVRITKLDVQTFHDESQRAIYFGVKWSKVKVKNHKTNAGVSSCTLVSAGFF